MSAEGLTEAMRGALVALQEIDDRAAKEMQEATPKDLMSAFKRIMTAMVPAALKDPLVRRNIKNHLIFLIERFSEKLQDLAETGQIQNASEYMKWIDKAHRYAVRLASAKGSGKFVENFDVEVQPVSILDAHTRRSPEERQAKASKLQEQFLRYSKSMRAGDE